ncbi:MAG: hypothetical protein JST41_03635 [Bacteroidetes bacterium]|nr:hypothetical protein [Bacteroidota bacterium]MBX7129424.1 DUF3106 domain-containing protein [Flavobacteriales bacterium]MCC6655982.1 hypothetical protein [Flavobacteriales bacterium]HMU14052.1 hypothetical protein [Flavobacteriales bacterium]HMW96197.1 hypothetical protein [Flavobacteriales bacterium]
MYHFRPRHLLFPLIPIAAVAVFSLVVMLLWNAIIPGITGWAVLSYWKAMGLLVLCKILFSGPPGRRFGPGGGHWAGRRAGMRMAWWRNLSPEEREQWQERRKEWRATWQGMDPEQRAKFKASWKARCGGWQEKNDPA